MQKFPRIAEISTKVVGGGTSATTQQLHTANDLATHFTTKVNNERQSTATATPPVIRGRVSSALSTLQPVTATEVTKPVSYTHLTLPTKRIV